MYSIVCRIIINFNVFLRISAIFAICLSFSYQIISYYKYSSFPHIAKFDIQMLPQFMATMTKLYI